MKERRMDTQKAFEKEVRKDDGKDMEKDALREMLMQVRSQALVAACMRERMGEEEKELLRSTRLDGMPRGAASRSGLDARLIRQEETVRILKREEARYRRLEKKARTAMNRMKPEMYAFCTMYYLGGMSLTETAEAIDRSERQCMRYRREIEGKAQ